MGLEVLLWKSCAVGGSKCHDVGGARPSFISHPTARSGPGANALAGRSSSCNGRNPQNAVGARG